MKANLKGLAIILAIVVVFLIAVFSTLREWTFYWIYSKPLYTLFGDSLYSPVYVHWAGALLVLAVLLIIFIITFKKKISKIISALILLAIMSFFSYRYYQDIVCINTQKYTAIECNLDSMKRIKRHSHGHIYYDYQINSNEIIGKRYVWIEMDFYQYRELLKLQNEKGNKIIQVYYLPSSKRMLKYE
jgi:hypothetical protein